MVESRLRDLDGIVIPGGFGPRAIEGKIAAAGYAREHEIPCLGLCLGLQTMVIEFARNVCGMAGANSSEFDPDSPYPVIDLMDEQREVVDFGGTQRLGLYPARLVPGSQVAAAYGEPLVYERHRHRYEFNPRYRRRLEECGLVPVGTSPDDRLVEFVELDRPPVLDRHPGPPRVQEPARPPPPAVPGLRGRRPLPGPRVGRRTCSSSTPPTSRARSTVWVPQARRAHRLVGARWSPPAPARSSTPTATTFERDVVHHPGAVVVVPVDRRRGDPRPPVPGRHRP